MEYLHFNFNGVSSAKYNLIVQNKGEDLSYASQPSFENQIVSPLYQGTNYLAGVNIKERNFTFNCWADSLTQRQVVELISWLSINSTGRLLLDYNTSFFYNMKISSISDFKHMAINSDGTVNYEFTISFVSIQDFASQSIELYSSVEGKAPNGLDLGKIDGNDIYIYNTYALPLYLDFNIASLSQDITIIKDDITYYNYPVNGNYTLNTKYGFCVSETGELIESLNPNLTFTNLGPMPINSNLRVIEAIRTSGFLIYDHSLVSSNTLMFVNGSDKLYDHDHYSDIITDLGLVEGSTLTINCIEPVKLNLSEGITYSFRLRDNY